MRLSLWFKGKVFAIAIEVSLGYFLEFLVVLGKYPGAQPQRPLQTFI
jgi:hypothetical protein